MGFRLMRPGTRKRRAQFAAILDQPTTGSAEVHQEQRAQTIGIPSIDLRLNPDFDTLLSAGEREILLFGMNRFPALPTSAENCKA